MNSAVILLGSNSGDKIQNLNEALKSIEKNAGKIIKASLVYETAPWGNQDQDIFLNQVIVVSTSKKALRLMDILLEIELSLGRVRREKWEPRVIDLDILYYNDEIIRDERLIIPHPHLHERRFTMVPLTEVLPEMVHPVFLQKNKDILRNLSDPLQVSVFKQAELSKKVN